MKMRMKNRTKGDSALLVVLTTLLIAICVIMIYPLVYVLSASFSSPLAVMSGQVVLWPVDPTIEGYTAVFSNNMILKGYLYTIYYMVVGTALGVFMNLIAAYPLSRPDFRARNFIMIIFAITMFFSGGMIPTYLLIKNLKIMNTIWALVLPGAVNVWNVIIIRTFYSTTISSELLEAAQIDGCSNRWFFFRCVLPLSKAIIAVMVLFTAVGYWNSYMSPLLYLNDVTRYPLQLVLRSILIKNTSMDQFFTDSQSYESRKRLEYLLKYSVIVVSSVPVLLAYPFVQKYFVKGVMIGSLKG